MIQLLKFFNININFLPNKLLEYFKLINNYKNKSDSDKNMIGLKESLKKWIKIIEFLFCYDFFKYAKLDNFIIKLLIVKYKTGFVLDIKSNGLTKAVNDLLSDN